MFRRFFPKIFHKTHVKLRRKVPNQYVIYIIKKKNYILVLTADSTLGYEDLGYYPKLQKKLECYLLCVGGNAEKYIFFFHIEKKIQK